jgi:hypothetical protein
MPAQPEALAAAICQHEPADCGCWLDPATGAVKRHAFRFLVGDRVQWGGFAGMTGTVERGGAHLFVKWDRPEWAPTAFPANFEIRHCAVTA